METGTRFKLSALAGVILLACALADFATRRPVTDAKPTPDVFPVSPWREAPGGGAWLSHSRLKPGDPVLTVDAPAGTRAVVAELPSGSRKLCRPDGRRGRWTCRFLVPRWTADGRYAVRVVAVGDDGSRTGYSAEYRVDSQAPVMDVRARREGRAVVFKARPRANVIETAGGSSRLHDVKRLTLLYGGRRVPLRLDRKARTFTWTARVPAGPGSAFLEAVDFAGNAHRQEVALP